MMRLADGDIPSNGLTPSDELASSDGLAPSSGPAPKTRVLHPEKPQDKPLKPFIFPPPSSSRIKKVAAEYLLITVSIIVVAIGVYFFKFPYRFTFGGVTGLAIAVEELTSLSAGTVNFIINAILVVLGFIFLGRGFGMKTVYASLLLSVLLSAMEKIYPMAQPLTEQPLLELAFATGLPAFGSAILFNIGASSGGTDIVAMILKKYTSFNTGTALMVTDVLITLSAFFIFDITTGLYSCLGLLLKSLVVDGVIESINLCKYFTIICDNPEPICSYITGDLNRSATITDGTGAFSHHQKYVIFTVLSRGQAVQLRNHIRQAEPSAFILITNSSEIVGKGFQR